MQCVSCGKPRKSAGGASLTGWIFKESRCVCIDSELEIDESGEIATGGTIEIPKSLEARFEFLRMLGKGGMGIVFQVQDRGSGKILALKILNPGIAIDASHQSRFLNEASVCASLDHPGIISVCDFGVSDEGTPFLLMEYAEGKTLSVILKEKKSLPYQRALSIFTEIADALTHAHARGVVHRDIKPGNVIIASDGAGADRVKLVDFGIAKFQMDGTDVRVRGDVTKAGQIMGSPFYMSPEQCRCEELDARSDIYSFGCMMFETLCGRPPFDSHSAIKVIVDHLTCKPPSPRKLGTAGNVTRSVESLILRCLEKDRSFRYQSMAAVLKDLNAIHKGSAIKPARMERINQLKQAIAALCLVATVVLVYFIGTAPGPKRAIKTSPAASPETVARASKNGQEMVVIGYMHATGRGTRQDFKAAAEYYEKASTLGNNNGTVALGVLYENGQGVPQNYEKAAALYEQAALQGNADGQHNLALLYEIGKGVKQDPGKSYHWYLKAAEQGHSASQASVANLYERGFGVKRDLKKSFDWAMKAAKARNAQGEFDVACHYEFGIGVDKNYEKAMSWYSLSMQHGNTAATKAIGDLYLEGKGVARDYGKAISYYENASQASDPDAMASMAHMYELGLGVFRDTKKAFNEYKKAADLGSLESWYKLAEFYRTGKGTEKNTKKADYWLKGASARAMEMALEGDPDYREQYRLRMNDYFNGGKGFRVQKRVREAVSWHEDMHENGTTRDHAWGYKNQQ